MARARPCSARRAAPARPQQRCVATTPPGTGRCGGSWPWVKPEATSPAPRRRASSSLSSAFPGSSRSRTSIHQAQRVPGWAIARRRPGQCRYAYQPIVAFLLDVRLAGQCVAETKAGRSRFARRHRQRGERPVARPYPVAGWCAARRKAAAAGAAVPIDRYADNPQALAHTHINQAIAAAIFDDTAGLARHTEVRCRCSRLWRATTRPPSPTCCAGWPSPRRPAPRTVTNAAICWPHWTT